jgi:hypothetical protein
MLAAKFTISHPRHRHTFDTQHGFMPADGIAAAVIFCPCGAFRSLGDGDADGICDPNLTEVLQ